MKDKELFLKIVEDIKAIELDESLYPYYDSSKTVGRKELHNDFQDKLVDYFKSLIGIPDLDFTCVKKEFEYPVPTEVRKWELVGDEYRFVELSKDEKLKNPISDCRADIGVEDKSGKTFLIIEIDTSNFQSTVPDKFITIPTKYRIWVYLRKNASNPKTAIKGFGREVERLEKAVCGRNVTCILRYPNLEPIVKEI